MTWDAFDALGNGVATLGQLLGAQQQSQYQQNLAAQQQSMYASQLSQLLGQGAWYDIRTDAYVPRVRPSEPRCAYCGVRYATRVGHCASCGAPL